VVITFRDLDEMTRLMQEVSQKNSEILVERNKLADILNSITDGVFTIDLNWRITSINHAAQKITGYSEKEALGKECGWLLRGNRCDFNCPMRGTIETGIPTKNMEVEIQNKAGDRIPISVSTALLRDDQNEIIGAVETFRDLSDIRKLSQALESRYRFDRILGKSKPMQELYDLLENVIETDSTVLIQGESGTGKELVARAIHFNSQRRNKPFIAVNCSALSENLLESELFGHEKGAFTGAIRKKPGRFELANGGTLFLDEVADMSPGLQVKILRVLDEQFFERVGATQAIRVNVRIITATNKNLYHEVKQHRFREDLYYRLNVVPIHLPPLRERKQDIHLLITHFIEHFNQKMAKTIQDLSPDALELLSEYHWPGNVRELENAIEHAFVRCRGEEILIQHLPKQIKDAGKQEPEQPIQPLKIPLQKTEREVLLKVLEEVNFDR
jgi:PAS domain S-box-containing protein